jgi:hypothetical protein
MMQGFRKLAIAGFVPQKIHEKLINKTVAGQLSGERKIIPLQK